jgi:hypothetical protein
MKKQNVQMTGVVTATTTNGNGNGKKAESVKPIDNVRVDENFGSENAIRITPHFPVLATKGVEMYTNMSNLENAKLFIDGLAMELQDDAEMAGLLMILDSIKRKLNGEDSDYLGAEDYINWLQDYIFNWTSAAGDCKTAYIKAIRSGNFAVGELPQSDGEVWGEGIYPPKYKQKAKDSGLRAEISALAETVKNLQTQINGKSFSTEKEPKTVYANLPEEPADFEGLWLSEVLQNDLILINYSLLLDVQQFPGEKSPRVINSVYKGRTDGNFTIEINKLPDSTEAYPYSFEDGEMKLAKPEPIAAPKAEPTDSTIDNINDFANQIAVLLAHPLMPESLHTAITEEIWDLSNKAGRIDIYASREFISKVLELCESNKSLKDDETATA